MASTNSTLVGWQQESGGRGTWKILWSCLTTIVLAVWVCYHPPAMITKWDSPNWWTKRVNRLTIIKMFTALIGVVVPELYMSFGIAQLIEARNIRKAFRNQGHAKFSLREAYFIHMGGYRIRVPEFIQLRMTTYVLDTERIYWLLAAGILGMAEDEFDSDQSSTKSSSIPLHETGPVQVKDSTTEQDSPINVRQIPQAFLLDREAVGHRAHSDGLAKSLVVLQCLYFIVNCIGRGAHRLPLSQLEILVLSYIVITFGAYAFWWEKPQNIAEPVVYHLTLSRQQWDELNYCSSVGWAHEPHMWTDMGGLELRSGQEEQNASQQATEWLGCFTLGTSAAIHFIAWNAEFPSRTEQIIWRVFCIILVILPLFSTPDGVHQSLLCGASARVRKNFTSTIGFIGFTLAILGKLGILVLALMSLRASPEAVYETWKRPDIDKWNSRYRIGYYSGFKLMSHDVLEGD